MADCRWADPQDRPPQRAVPLGRKYELASGLMEITYQTGAKVILQGPCTYEVDSASRRLPLAGQADGKSGEGRGQGSGVRGRNPKSEISNHKSLIPSPLSPLPCSPSALPPPWSPTWARSSAWKWPKTAPPSRTLLKGEWTSALLVPEAAKETTHAWVRAKRFGWSRRTRRCGPCPTLPSASPGIWPSRRSFPWKTLISGPSWPTSRWATGR